MVNIQPIVEGHGEVAAVPILIRRLCEVAGLREITVNQPIRKPRSQLVGETPLRNAIRLARKLGDRAAILVLFDSDDGCPRELGPRVQTWARAEAGGLPCEVVVAHHEFEAWFLAAIESLRGVRGVRSDAESHPNPETPRGAKEQLQQRLDQGRSYSETADQPALTTRFDLGAAHRGCRSFRRVVKAFGELATGLGQTLPEPWPPTGWLEDQS